MDQLKEFRLAAWLDRGLMVRIKSSTPSLPTVSIAAGLLAAAIGMGSIPAWTNFDFSLSQPSRHDELLPVLAQASHHPAMVRIRELGREIQRQSAEFGSADTSDVDEEMLALARQALVAHDQRRVS